MLGKNFFGILDELSCSLQREKMSAADAKHASNTVSKTILNLRSEKGYESFWTQATTRAAELFIRTLSATVLQTSKAF